MTPYLDLKKNHYICQCMDKSIEKYGLEPRLEAIMEEYRNLLPVFGKMKEIIPGVLHDNFDNKGVYVTAVETRIKKESSLAGKLKRKGYKYHQLSDITDILGCRIITFYLDDVDKISAIVDNIFDIDWTESVDKRKARDLISFGYSSLHYICRIPKSLYFDSSCPQINEIRFEIQMRTALQHVWATLEHDIGYKSSLEMPQEYIRNLHRLAGMLELVDEQFSIIRTSLNDYKRKVDSLVMGRKLSDVPLNNSTWQKYLSIYPFDNLNQKIAAINQAEIHETSLMPYCDILLSLGFKTLEDVHRLILDESESAYQLATFEIGNTDLDIISSTVAIQDLLIAYVILNDGDEDALTELFNKFSGESSYNRLRAQNILSHKKYLQFMNLRDA